MKRAVIIPVLFLFLTAVAFAQVDQKMGSFPESAVKGYVQPLIDVMGANLNSGLYHTASMSKLFGFYIGVKAMAVFVPSSMKTFTAELGSDYTPSSVKTATVLGDEKGGATTKYKGVADVTLSGGIGLSLVPFGVPQVAVSTMNTELLVRFVPSIKINDEIGNVNLLGIGLGHSISQYIPMFPINVAVQGVYQQLKVGSYLKATALNANVHASKSFVFFTIYGGVGYEQFSADLNYKYELPLPAGTKQISFSLKGKNKFRATAGFKFKFAVLDLNVDYSIGSVNVLSAGLGFSF